MDTSRARTISDLPESFNAAEDILAPNLARHPDKIAIIDAHGSCTYAVLADRVARSDQTNLR